MKKRANVSRKSPTLSTFSGINTGKTFNHALLLLMFPNRDPPEPTGDEPEDFEYEAPKIYEPVRNSSYSCVCSVHMVVVLY